VVEDGSFFGWGLSFLDNNFWHRISLCFCPDQKCFFFNFASRSLGMADNPFQVREILIDLMSELKARAFGVNKSQLPSTK